MSPRLRKRIVVSIIGAGLLGFAIWARRSLGIEYDPHSLREWVLDLGPVAPIALVALIALRAAIGVPSQLVLIVAGLCFGVVIGTFYGALGLTISGLGTFLLARYAGRDAIEPRIPDRVRPFVEQAGERPGAVFVAIGTGYPIGFITAYHALAGVTPMRLTTFAIALIVGSTARAATYTYFGSSLVAGGLRPVIEATLLLGILLALPLLFTRTRTWLLKVVLARN
jgi:uncharacterized membrane protein YdjX (TVP38/TMEM64 family)